VAQSGIIIPSGYRAEAQRRGVRRVAIRNFTPRLNGELLCVLRAPCEIPGSEPSLLPLPCGFASLRETGPLPSSRDGIRGAYDTSCPTPFTTGRLPCAYLIKVTPYGRPGAGNWDPVGPHGGKVTSNGSPGGRKVSQVPDKVSHSPQQVRQVRWEMSQVRQVWHHFPARDASLLN
jgi:hypothetical protein